MREIYPRFTEIEHFFCNHSETYLSRSWGYYNTTTWGYYNTTAWGYLGNSARIRILN